MVIPKLTRVEKSPGNCVVRRDVCKVPVQLTCGHIQCESRLHLLFSHHYEGCPQCFTKLYSAGSRYSILYSKAIICVASFTLECCFHYKHLRRELLSIAKASEPDVYTQLPVEFELFIGEALPFALIMWAFCCSILEESDWWRDFGAFHRPQLLLWPLFFTITSLWALNGIVTLLITSK